MEVILHSSTLSIKLKQNAYLLNPKIMESILGAVATADKDRLINSIRPLHAADLADILEQISKSERKNLVALWGTAIDGEVLSELEEGVRDEILLRLPEKVLVNALRRLESDKIVYLLENLSEAMQGKLLKSLEISDRRAVEQALKYSEHTAGRLMQCELVALPEHWTVGDSINLLRSALQLPESFYNVVVVSPKFHPIGTVQLGRLMSSNRSIKLVDLLDQKFQTISVTQSQEDVAYAFKQYHLVSAPVVDTDGRLVGTITIDDVMEVLEEETEQDLKRLTGLGKEELSDSIFNIVKTRFPWLLTNLFTAIVVSLVIAQFATTIQAIVALAVLMPIVASMGGNAGTQTLTLAVRAIATRDLTRANGRRVVLREFSVGIINGLIFAGIMGLVGYVWYDSIGLGIVLAFAMIFNLIIAGLSGVLLPMGLSKMGVDPALASAVFLTTFTDIIGFLSFLGLATIFLI